MKIDTASLSHIGRVRQRNEDSSGFSRPTGKKEREERGSIFVVADGMGGHRGGDIASRIAVDTVITTYYASGETNPKKALQQSFSEANQAILDKSRNEVNLFGMGTTCTAMVVINSDAYFAHVGDSRAYVLRGGELNQITEDHSLVGEMVKSGIISNEDAVNHPKRNVITRSLGTHPDLVTDFPDSPFKLEGGDIFLLCTDGLTSLVNDSELKEILASQSPPDACNSLVERANQNGGKDNVTVQVLHVSED
jgi:protein phosphatase